MPVSSFFLLILGTSLACGMGEQRECGVGLQWALPAFDAAVVDVCFPQGTAWRSVCTWQAVRGLCQGKLLCRNLGELSAHGSFVVWEGTPFTQLCSKVEVEEHINSEITVPVFSWSN